MTVRGGMRGLRRAALRGLALGVLAMSLTLTLSGCATLTSFFSGEPAAGPEASAEKPGQPVFDVKIEAPDDLAKLLQTHLDLVRLRTLPDGRDLDPVEWSRLIAATPAQARELLETEGYFDAEVRVQREPQTGAVPAGASAAMASAGTSASAANATSAASAEEAGASAPTAPNIASSMAHSVVRITVEPGPRTTVSKLRIELQGDIDREVEAAEPSAVELDNEVRKKWPMPVGTVFRNPEWSRAKTGLLAELRAAGYAAASLSGSSARVFAERREAELLVVADSGPPFLAGGLVIKGLQRQDEITVRNLAGFTPGTRLSEALLLDYQERLANAGLFDSATVTADTDPEHAGAADITVQVRESPLQQATLGGGVSANTGPRVALEYTHRRLFDFALTAHEKIEWGRDLQSINSELSTHPGENFYRTLYGLQLERLLSDTDVVRSARVRAGRSQSTTRNERFYFVELEKAERQVTVDSTERPLDVLAASLNYQVIFRRLDSIILPTEGYSLSLQGGVGHAQSPDNGGGPFTRLYGRATGYLPLGRNWYGQGRVELGEVFVPAGVDTPDSQRFRAGGDESVRGYAYRSLAPTQGIVVDSGKVLFTGSVELARPIVASLPSVWGAVFLDAGRAADSWGGFKPALGYGFGVRWRSPVGPLKLDLAYGQEVKTWRLHFSLGIAF